MINIIKHEIVTKESSWEELKEKAIAGAIEIGDQISAEFDGRPTLFDVIGIDADKPVKEYPGSHGCLTIQMHDLIEERPFDTKGDWGSNVWENSEIRAYLNSSEFKSRFADLVEHIVPVWKDNKGSKPTADEFFLLSKKEVDPARTPYPFYQDKRNRMKFDTDDHADWNWLRSAYRGNAYFVWYVDAGGYVGSYSASNAYRSAPACTLIF